jgi:hypothetical protein
LALISSWDSDSYIPPIEKKKKGPPNQVFKNVAGSQAWWCIPVISVLKTHSRKSRVT